MRLNKDNIKKDPDKDKRYYAKLKERMEADPELKEKRLEQQRARGKTFRELVKAKKIVANNDKNTEPVIELL